MTSFHGYTNGSYAYTDLYNTEPAIQCTPPRPGTVMHVLENNSGFYAFKNLVYQVPSFETKFRRVQGKYTLFIPLDYRAYDNIQSPAAFLEKYVVNQCIPMSILRSSPIHTVDDGKILVEIKENGEILLNKTSVVLDYLEDADAYFYLISYTL